MDNEKLFPEYQYWVERMLEEIEDRNPDGWAGACDLTLRQVYDMTYDYLEVHPQRRVLAMLVLNRLFPEW